MRVFYQLPDFQQWLVQQRENKSTLGFVPTMGALHQGHMSLIEASNEQNQITVCSIFVNPTQFNNAEDLKKYPRTIESDLQLLERNACHAVFVPLVNDMYPEGEKSKHYLFDGIEDEMEGKFRPGHFDGVATIVSRFFDIVQPNRAYFGEKDFQQLRIIQELVKQDYPTLEIVPVKISREEDGLARSSRNQRLTNEFRAVAPKIYQSLQWVEELKNNGLSVNEINKKMEVFYQSTPLELEYFILADETTLKPIIDWNESENVRAFSLLCWRNKID